MDSKEKPQRLGSIRTRIALLYSVLLFGLASIILGVIYLSFSQSLSDEKISQQNSEIRQDELQEGDSSRSKETQELILFEEKVNQNALEQ